MGIKNTESVEQMIDVDPEELKLIEQGKMKQHSSHGYVNNKELYEECKRYHQMKMKAIENGDPIPPLTEKQGEAIIQIATRRCNSRMYAGYTNNWKEEMISNAMMTGAIQCHKFDPINYDNPFAYYTQIIDNAIKEQLKYEKRELYVRHKSVDEHHGFFGTIDEENMSESDLQGYNEIKDADEERIRYIRDFEERNFKKKDKSESKPSQASDNSVSLFNDDESES